jgi:hypothetical protein
MPECMILVQHLIKCYEYLLHVYYLHFVLFVQSMKFADTHQAIVKRLSINLVSLASTVLLLCKWPRMLLHLVFGRFFKRKKS